MSMWHRVVLVAAALACATHVEARRRTPARPPMQRAGLVTTRDYPAAALSRGEAGIVTMRLTVSAQGVVTACAVTQSSGSNALDSASCNLAIQRFRFTPARDTNGRNVAGTSTRRISWNLPGT